jgi:hypothetical protein
VVRVQPVADAVADGSEFAVAVAGTKADAVVVLAHMDMRDPLAETILAAVRRYRGQDFPVVFLCGHSHYDAYMRMDSHAAAVEGGCYLNRVAFISFDLPKGKQKQMNNNEAEGTEEESLTTGAAKAVLEFSPAGVAANVAALGGAVGGTVGAALPRTLAGEKLRRAIARTREGIGATKVLGNNPLLRSVTAFFQPGQNSFWWWYMTKVVPTTLFQPSNHAVDRRQTATPPQWMVSGTGAARYDLWAGDVTVDDIYTTFPFADDFFVFQDIVDGAVLSELEARLNNGTGVLGRPPLVGRSFPGPALPAGAGASPASLSPRLPMFVSTGAPDKGTSYEVIVPRFDSGVVESVLADITGRATVPMSLFRPGLNSTAVLIRYFQGGLAADPTPSHDTGKISM